MFADFRTEAMFSQRLKRAISALLLFFFSFTFYSPAVFAAWTELDKQSTPVRNSLAHINPIGETLQALSAQVDGLEQALNAKDDDAVSRRLQQIQMLSATLEERDALTRKELRGERDRLEQEGATAEVLARHRAFQENYLANMTGLEDTLGRLDRISYSPALKPLISELRQYLQQPVRNPQQSFSNDLDFVTPPPRRLYTSQSAIEGVLGVNGEPAWSLTDYLEVDSATRSTQRIEDLVADLGPDPLALYQWVKNTIRYVPSYGVMQGADYTVQSEQGNAFDTASTLIALYREAGIPARYSYGTVSLPAEAIQNWVGGVSNIHAATNIISQGGIPQQQLSYGGAAEEVELEHVWVEAWINGEWVALDPAFKQYTYTEGLDIESQVPLDADQFLVQLQSSATINEAEGWVQGLDVAQVQAQLDDYQTRVESYINSQNSNATLGDVLGTQQIVPDKSVSIENVQLPYRDIRASAVAPNLPESLYYKFRLQIGNTTGGSFGIPVQWGGVSAELERTTTELVGKSIAISFRPATIADQQTLETYLPENPQSVEDLPDQLPANTIQMIGEITVDGEVVASTPSVTLGQSLMTRLGFDAPERSWRYSENNLVAGKYQAVGIDMQGISPDQLEALKSRVEQTAAKLTAEDFSGLTKHDLVGSILQAGIQGYLAETYAMDKIAAAAS
ncbi:transglutaminase-like domain-containing protein, partial [Marinobacter sp.]|uniref:transglutaminase-like domain-containing protein n=1 Tax=Marinobacter sp. TaxID=50741 RepID=UPI002B492E49